MRVQRRNPRREGSDDPKSKATRQTASGLARVKVAARLHSAAEHETAGSRAPWQSPGLQRRDDAYLGLRRVTLVLHARRIYAPV
jgi:hypothetical protein